MLLNEVLNAPVEWKTIEDNDYGYAARFEIGGLTYEFVAETEDEDHMDIDFFLMKKDGPTTAVTNTGNALQVFATVIAIIKKVISKRKPATIAFSAKEGSRIKLYDRLAKLLPSIGYSLVSTKTNAGGKGYEFAKG